MVGRIRTALFVGLVALTVTGCKTTSDIETKDAFGLAVTNQADIANNKLVIGAKHYAAANYGLAEASFREAVEATPENSRAWLGLAASYDQLGRFELADRAYEQLLKKEGRKASILNNIGYSHLLRGDMKKARTYLSEAAVLAPDNKIISGNLAIAKKG